MVINKIVLFLYVAVILSTAGLTGKWYIANANVIPVDAVQIMVNKTYDKGYSEGFFNGNMTGRVERDFEFRTAKRCYLEVTDGTYGLYADIANETTGGNYTCIMFQDVCLNHNGNFSCRWIGGDTCECLVGDRPSLSHGPEGVV